MRIYICCPIFVSMALAGRQYFALGPALLRALACWLIGRRLATRVEAQSRAAA